MEQNTSSNGAVETAPHLHFESNTRRMWRVFRQNKLAVASLFYFAFVILSAIIVPFLFPRNYFANVEFSNNTCFDMSNAGRTGNAGPSIHHIFGCIGGIDTWGLICQAGRYSLAIALVSSVITMTLGVAYGMTAGIRGGRFDTISMRIVDVLLSIPGLYLLLMVLTLLGKSFIALIVVIGFTGWFGVARLMRAETLTLRQRDFVAAAQTMGASRRRILTWHVLPNAISTMATVGTFALGDAVLILSGLGFLGLGLTPPQFDWGSIIQDGSAVFQLGYWWELWPTAIIFILFVLSTNFLGDALRDAFEVRFQDRS